MGFNPGAEIIFRYFPDLTTQQKDQFLALGDLYRNWNQKINVISRKDMVGFYQNHVLHSLGIAKAQRFHQKDQVLDVGTGGGFPGIPLAILYPKAQFQLIDSIGKKVKVVNDVIDQLGLTNVKGEQIRAEQIQGRYHYIISRAVSRLSVFIPWISNNLLPKGQILCIKGGNLLEEIREIGSPVELIELSDFFTESFFETKKVLKIKGL